MVDVLSKANIYLHSKVLKIGQLSYVTGKIRDTTIEVDLHIISMDARLYIA